MVHGKYVECEGVIDKFLPQDIHVYYFCGGRGIGKTYGALDLCRKIGTGEKHFDDIDSNEKFLYLRRTATEAATIATPELCPFKKYNSNEGYNINADFNGKLGFGNFYLDLGKKHHIGYCAGLSTFANLRGVDYSDVSLILYDECIPENKNKHPLKDEGYLVLDMLETINRNRALENKPEVIFVMLSNPIELGNPMLTQLDLVSILNSMIFKNQERYTSKARSLHIEKYKDHEVSKEKGEKSMLYRFASTTGYNERSLSGDFVTADLDLIKSSEPLNSYVPYIRIENICIYEHKSNGTFYVSQKLNKCKHTFKARQQDLIRELFYWRYKKLMIYRMIFFDNYATKVVLESMLNYKPTFG